MNGLDVDDEGTLHVTWCYRDYVDHPKGGKPQQAGPNGPENVSYNSTLRAPGADLVRTMTCATRTRHANLDILVGPGTRPMESP